MVVLFGALLPRCGDGGDGRRIDDVPGGQETAEVRMPREMRGVWIASVSNINFPSQQGSSAASQQAELDALVATAAQAHLNAIFFQVRPESDALYDSPLEPWSRYLTGTQGADPGYDPLAYLIAAAHARAIEVHAWLNPYRAKANESSVAHESHVSQTLAQHAIVYGNLLWMDPGARAVQDHVVAVIEDLVTRYDLDGIHFDDYFYPYPDGTVFADDASYTAYLEGGGTMARGTWRRDNVNTLVRRAAESIAVLAPHVRFGISPFGIYRPGQPEGIVGLDQYAELYADPPTWKRNGWVDYLAPQLYWPSTQTAQAFEPLIGWWTALPDVERATFAGCYLSKLGTSASWTVDELRTQVALTRAQAVNGAGGNIFFHLEPLAANTLGIRDVFANELYASPAVPPPTFALRDTTLLEPRVSWSEGGLRVEHDTPSYVRAWGVYRWVEEAWAAARVIGAGEEQLELEPGRWAVSAIARWGIESPGVVVEVR